MGARSHSTEPLRASMKPCNVKYVAGSLLACTMLMAPRLALAGPPFMTDDPEPVEYRHHELYISSQLVKTQDGRSGTLPHLEYNYGAAPDLQLHIIVPYAFNSPVHGQRESGLGDVELGIKYRFMQETDSRPMVGIFPLVETHTGDASKGLGNGATQVYLPVWLQKRWGKWQSYGGGGYWINNAANARNHWFFGWQLQKDVSEHLTLGGEIFHNTEQISGQGGNSGFNLGGFYNFDKHNHLLFSAGRGLTNVNMTNQLSSYVGYQLTW
ncbi:MAG TPA: transporter [Sulfuriferula sp.]|nr:transporter [Sulfuriferula sp.]